MSPKQISKELCQEIINKNCADSEVNVISFSLAEQQNTVFAHEYVLKVLARDHEDKSYSFILKIPSTKCLQQFESECSIYDTLPSKQNICAPCFYRSNSKLVLDNLLGHGYSYNKASFDHAHIKLALRKIAEFHTLGEVNNIHQNITGLLEHLKILHQEFMKKIKDDQLQTYDKCDFEKKLAKLFEQLEENLKPSNEFINVICHGDLRKENLLFTYENDVPVDCKLTNCYFIHYSPPGNDVLFFLNNYTNEKQKKHFREYLEFYFQCLNENLKTVASVQFDDFYLSCKMLLKTTKLRSSYLGLEPNNITVAKLEDVLTNSILSAEDCYEILNKKFGSTNYTLLNYCVQGFSERFGLLGDHFNLKINVLTACGEKQLSFFIKTIPTAPSQREFGMANGALFKEHRMYTKLIPLLKEHKIDIFEGITPKTYFSRLNDVMVQEDLKQQGFLNLDRKVSLGFAEIKTLLITLAKFHASFIVLEERISRERGYTYRLINEFPKEFKEVFFCKEQPIVADGLNACKTGAHASVDTFYSKDRMKINKDTMYQLLDSAIDKQEENGKPSKSFRNTISHGDLWVNNVLFKYNSNSANECKVIDFQSYRYHPPAHDVLCVLYLTTDREFRRKYFDEALRIYFEELTNAFSVCGFQNIITKKEFEESCKFYKESVLTQTMTHFQCVLIPDDINKYLFDNPDELRHVFFKDKYDFLMKMFVQDSYFRRRNEEIFLDLVEHFESLYVKP